MIANKFPASNEILSKRFQYDVSKKDIKVFFSEYFEIQELRIE